MGFQEQVMKGGVLCVPQRTMSVTLGKGWSLCRVFRCRPAPAFEKQIEKQIERQMVKPGLAA
jgi:hypothetical protein